jgi:citrate synthase
MSDPRKTAVSWVEAEKITIRGFRIEDMMENMSFASAIYLILRGEKPSEPQAQLFNAILVSVIDHGVRPPSTIAAVTVANTGSNLNSAVAAGILAINSFHGGAIEKAMAAISECAGIGDADGLKPLYAARRLVSEYKSAATRISGFGHRFHASDPRTVRLFAMARELGIAGRFVENAEAIEVALSETSGRNLPINADGAIAALLCELGFPPKAANGLFMIARVPGLVAHVIEEQERNEPMRTVDVERYEYDGHVESKRS